MTPSEEIRRALERLESGEAFVNIEVPRVFANALEAPLAALIRKAAEPQDTNSLGLEHSAGWCVICGGPANGHRSACALLALVRAINGEQT